MTAHITLAALFLAATACRTPAPETAALKHGDGDGHERFADELSQTPLQGQPGLGCTLNRAFIMGTPRNFGVAPGGSLEMTCKDGIWKVEETFAGTGNVFSAGAFKFHETGDWNAGGRNWGDFQPLDGKADVFGDGNDIVIKKPGIYRVQLDDRTFAYRVIRKSSACAADTLIVSGVSSATGADPLFCVGDDVYGGIMMFSNGDASYTIAGDQARTMPQSGRYLFTYDAKAKNLKTRLVSAACKYPAVYARGSFNNWEKLAMECENGHYALSLGAAGVTTEFKFDVVGDWSKNFGVNGDFRFDGIGHIETAENGGNIRIFGRHHVHFYNDDKFAMDRHD